MEFFELDLGRDITAKRYQFIKNSVCGINPKADVTQEQTLKPEFENAKSLDTKVQLSDKKINVSELKKMK